MTAIALISDLHANLVALDTVLTDIRRRSVDHVVCLGDIVDLGPEPRATVERLRQEGIACVLGNHDGLNEKPALPLLAEIERWTAAQLDASSRAFLDDLPDRLSLDLGAMLLLCVHGSPRSCHESLLASTPDEQLRAWRAHASFDVLAAGHTHVPLTRFFDGAWFINTGSVGMPFAEPFAGKPPRVLKYCDYAIVREDAGALSIEHRRLPLDFEAFARTLRQSSFPAPEAWLGQWT